jgi:hypothetical protein
LQDGSADKHGEFCKLLRRAAFGAARTVCAKLSTKGCEACVDNAIVAAYHRHDQKVD